MNNSSPLADVRQLLLQLPSADASAAEAVRARAGRGASAGLNRLEERAVWLAAWQGRAAPAVRQPLAAVFAASHGVARRGVSLQRAADARATVERLGQGTEALNGLCARFDIGLKVFELALDLPTADFTDGPALNERAAAATIAFGMEAVAQRADLLVLASLGAGGETAAAALGAALTGGDGAEWVESAALPEHVRLRRAEAIDAGLARHAHHLADPLECLCRLGGRDIAAMAGAILAARTQRIPVILDGGPAVAAALVLNAASAGAAEHCTLAQQLPSAALAEAARAAGLHPLLDLGLPDGSGQAGAAAAGLIAAAAHMAAALSPS